MRGRRIALLMALLLVFVVSFVDAGITIDRGNGPAKIVASVYEGNIVYVPVRIGIEYNDVKKCMKEFGTTDTLITVNRDGNVVAEVYGNRLDNCEVQINVPVGRVEEVNSGKVITLRAERRYSEGGYWIVAETSEPLYIRVKGNEGTFEAWKEGGRDAETNVSVHVSSPYKYDYEIVGNTVRLTLFVNFEARNSCYSIRTKVEEGNCENCYNVYVIRHIPAGSEICAEVYRLIPTITADVPIRGNNVYIYVQDREERIEANDCLAMEAKMYTIRRQLNACYAGECEDNAVRAMTEEYERLRKRYEEMNCGVPPEMPPRPIMPEPPGKPKPPVIEKNIPKIDVNVIIERLKMPKEKIKVKEVREEKNVKRIRIAVRKRLFGIIPIDIPVDVEVNGENIRESMPWWARALSIFSI